MKYQFFTGVALAALAIPAAALAQSSGTIDAEEETIVVTGSRTSNGAQGIQVPDSPKARTVLSNEYLRTQNPGQSVLQSINIVPSVNFTNNDPFGSSGGNVRIRGFDGNRISLTFDGLPLNDTGNYAIFSNQQLDPEVIDSVNVNQGTTDVDSPTAASSGGTINYRTIVPGEEFSALGVGSYGESYAGRQFNRAFGLIQTGDILGTGIRGFVAASSARADKYRGEGELFKEQYNARLYKTFGSNGDFVSIAGHFNRNRNSSFRSLSLAQAALDYANDGRFNIDNNPLCFRPTPVTGTAQNENTGAPQPSTTISSNSFVSFNSPGGLPGSTGFAVDNSCTNFSGVRINPSNTGNARFNSKYTISDTLTFTLDAGYQYVLANGGGFTTISETDARLRGAAGPTGPGVDLNGDTDTLDTIAVYSPNNTNTNRYTVLASLRWDFLEGQSVRVAYALDYGRHRQTGEYGFLNAIGNPEGPFGGRGDVRAVRSADGVTIRTRDRFSIAELNQVSGEYRGKFFDNRVEVLLGVRAPFFHRELNQYCFTQASNGNQTCSSQPLSTLRIIAPTDAIPTTGAAAFYAPYRATYNYRKVLPNVGLTFKPLDGVAAYASYAKGLSAPRTDNLYRAPIVTVQPETTDNFDAGVRYSSRSIQATFGGFYNKFQNRIVTSFDALTGISVDRNVGRVEIKGLEASVDVRPFPWLSFRGFGSYIDAKLKDNIPLGTGTGGVPIVALTAGKKLVETPEWQYGYRAQAKYGPVSIGANFKRVTSRFATDINDVKLPGYSTYDVDARISLSEFGLKNTFFQVNVNNVFDTQYLGSISSQIATSTNFAGQVSGIPIGANIPGSGTPTFQPGSPRSFVASIQVGF